MDRISSARTAPVRRELNAVYVDFPDTLRAGREYTIDFHYSGTPRETGRFGGIAFRKGRRAGTDQHGLRGRGIEHLVAEQG
jgi:hypothetical protein